MSCCAAPRRRRSTDPQLLSLPELSLPEPAEGAERRVRSKNPRPEERSHAMSSSRPKKNRGRTFDKYGPLPPGWKTQIDQVRGRRVYYNRATKQTSWHRPEDEREETKAEQALQYSSESLRGDAETVRIAVAQDGGALRYASESLRGDAETVRIAVAHHGGALQHASRSLRGDAETVHIAVAQDGWALQHASESLRGDAETVHIAVAQDGGALQHASESLRGDAETVRIAVAQRSCVLDYASVPLQQDPVLQRLDNLGDDQRMLPLALLRLGLFGHLEHVPVMLDRGIADKDVMIAVAKETSSLLMYASPELTEDEELMLEMVTHDCGTMQYASETLQNNTKFVLKAVSVDGGALEYAKALQYNKDVARVAVTRLGCALQHASEELQKDEELLRLAALKDDQRTLAHALTQELLRLELSSHLHHVLRMVEEGVTPTVLQRLDNLGDDQRMLPLALLRLGLFGHLEHVPVMLDRGIADKDVMIAVAKETSSLLMYASPELTEDEELMLEMVTHDCGTMQYASETLQNNTKFVLKAVSVDGGALEYAKALQYNKDVARVAVTRLGCALQHASEELQKDEELLRLAALKDDQRTLAHALTQELLRLELSSHLHHVLRMVEEGVTPKMFPSLDSIALTDIGMTVGERVIFTDAVKLSEGVPTPYTPCVLCLGCQEYKPVTESLMCVARHPVCDECLSNHVQQQLETVASQHQIRCIACGLGCDAPYDFQDLARHCSGEVFCALHDRMHVTRAESRAKLKQHLAVFEAAETAKRGLLLKHLDEQQLTQALKEQFPNAYMCRNCKHGPVDHFNCSNLSSPTAHNACPSCGRFVKNISDWDKWDGVIRYATQAGDR